MFGCLALLLVAQSAAELFEKAPPVVDQALRARINYFYQAQIEGKFRQAQEAVAEDSKDAFIAADKPRCRAFEVIKIAYSDNFTRARAVVTCDTEFVALPMGKVPVKMPLTTLWKMIDGQWYWYVDPEAGKHTPFGDMKPGPGGGGGPISIPGPAQAADLLKLVKADKTSVRLSSFEPSSDEVLIANKMPGKVTLAVDYTGFKGFEAKLDRTELGPNETARLSLRCTPADRSPKPTTVVTIRVSPTNAVIPIQVTFALPPELEKQLPKQ